jgi:hypothetical protein
MLRGVDGVEGKKETAPITMLVQKKTLKNTKTLHGGGGGCQLLADFRFWPGVLGT